MAPWLRYLIAFVVGSHGLIYVMFVPLARDALKEWRGTSWLLGQAVTGGKLYTLASASHIAAGVIILACALAIAFAPAAPGWWRPLAIVGAALGILAFAVFWDGQVQLLVQEGGIGPFVSLILLAVALAFPGAFG